MSHLTYAVMANYAVDAALAVALANTLFFAAAKADSTGKASFKMNDSMLSLSGANSVIGRSVIIHAKPDDMKTQPSGDSGDRIGCGVIGIADPKMQGKH